MLLLDLKHLIIGPYTFLNPLIMSPMINE